MTKAGCNRATTSGEMCMDLPSQRQRRRAETPFALENGRLGVRPQPRWGGAWGAGHAADRPKASALHNNPAHDSDSRCLGGMSTQVLPPVIIKRPSVATLVRSQSSAKVLSPRLHAPVTANEYVKVYNPGSPLPAKDPTSTRFVCVSDTHGLTDCLRLPEGDVLLHAGDFTETGKLEEVAHFNSWLATQSFRHKIVIAGNHDVTFDVEWYSQPHNQKRFHNYPQDPEAARGLLSNCTYLQDSMIMIDDKWKIWGSPWQPEFCNWAFNLPRGSALKEKWDQIPHGVDILLTHGPPANHGGLIRWDNSDVGCEELHAAASKRIRPKVHVFGHVHEGYGVTSESSSVFINCSTCTHSYKPTNPPVVFDLLQKKH